MTRVNLTNYTCFSERDKVDKLNRLIAINADLMPHQLVSATGCGLESSMDVLMTLFHLSLADLFLLVYHVAHQGAPILSRGISEGFPQLPFMCPDCEQIITEEDELTYNFLFHMKHSNIEFVLYE
jgi:hypothetical protein